MTDTVTRTTRTSWSERVLGSAVGALIGLLLVPAMLIGLFWNEGRAVTTARSLAEGAGVVIEAEVEAVDPGKEGQLVHVTGAVTATSRPLDAELGVAAEGIRLVRMAEMYQWSETSSSETRKELGGGEVTVTTYSYSREWSDEPINSSRFEQSFGHQNPPMAITGRSFQIAQARLGAFRLDSPVLDRLDETEPLPLAAADLPAIKAAYSGSAKLGITGSRLYLGPNPGSPRIGDIRVSYERVPLGPVSIVGRQSGSSFAPYPTQAGNRLLLVQAGEASAETMFADALTDNTLLTWTLRALGLALLTLGFGLVMAPLGVLGDIVPFVGNLVRMGTGLASLVLSLVLGGLTVAIAWFAYRPVVALGILAAALALAALLLWSGRGRDNASGKPAPQWGRAAA